MLAVRLAGVLLLGLSARAAVALLVRLIDPAGLAEVWTNRAGGPFALLGGLLMTWFSVLAGDRLWLHAAPALIAAAAGCYMIRRPRGALRRIPRRFLT